MTSIFVKQCVRLNKAAPLFQYAARFKGHSSDDLIDKQKQSESKTYNELYQDIFQNYADYEVKESRRETTTEEDHKILEPKMKVSMQHVPTATLTENGPVSDETSEHLKSQHLTHTDEEGQLNMVDVGNKPETVRSAVASSRIHLGSKTFQLVRDNNIQKGDVLTTAKIAGIMAAKNTSSLIPLCHPIALSKVAVDLELDEEEKAVNIYCSARTQGKTGVEMEALTGASVAALTIYDMCKAVNREMVIGETRLLKKTGGVRGDYEYQNKER